MGNKRKTHTIVMTEATPPTKRLRPSHDFGDGGENESQSLLTVQARVDPTYGQRGVFPGLEDDDNDELFYGPPSDGLEYLRMVR